MSWSDRLWFIAANIGYWCVVGTVVERAFAARPHRDWRTPGWRLDAIFVISQYALWLPVFNIVMAELQPRVQLFSWPQSTTWLVVGGVMVIVAGDVAAFAIHVLMHRVPCLWRFHRVHHNGHHLDWLAAHREHPVDGLMIMTAMNLPALLVGYPVRWLLPVFLLRGAWAVFIHCNVTMPGRFFRVLGICLGDPALHRAHHALTANGRTVNYSNLSPYLDILFGTHHRPDDDNYPIGADGPKPTGYVQQLLTR